MSPKNPTPKKPNSKVTVGTPTIQDPNETYASDGSLQVPGVDVTQLSPLDIQIKRAQQQPTLGQALQTVSGGEDQETHFHIPFQEFYAMTKGNKEKAEQLVPGITAPDGYKLIQAGPDGKPMVPVPQTAKAYAQQLQSSPEAQAAANRAAIDAKFAQAAQRRTAQAAVAKGNGNGPDWVPADAFAQALGAKSFNELSPDVLQSLMPGLGKEAGYMHWTRTAKDGTVLLPNPQGKLFRKLQAEQLSTTSTPTAMEGDY